MNDQLRFSSKAVLVIGGSRGIGAAIVRRFAVEGAAVALTYSSSPQKAEEVVHAIETQGGRAMALQADSADAEALRHAVSQAAKQLGGLDVLVINAGILIPGMVEDYALEDFDRMLAVNVRGVFVAIQAAVPLLPRGGRIITIGSNVALRIGFPGSSIYSMTKGAIASLVRGVAIDLAPRGITVNNVQPGPTVTDMTSTPGMIDAIKPLVPLGRMAEPGEIAGMVAYLASPEAGFVTGASLTIDGGYVA